MAGFTTFAPIRVTVTVQIPVTFAVKLGVAITIKATITITNGVVIAVTIQVTITITKVVAIATGRCAVGAAVPSAVNSPKAGPATDSVPV